MPPVAVRTIAVETSTSDTSGVHDRRAPERILQRLASFAPLRCAQCGRFSTSDAAGWRGHRTDLEDDGDLPAVAMFCPDCAELEFGER
jgi:hypothetical protein